MVLCSSVRIDNAQALADRYSELTGMNTWVVWNIGVLGADRFCLMNQGQLNCLGFSKSEQYQLIYCADQPGRWLIPPEVIDPPLAFGEVQQLTPALALERINNAKGDNNG